MPTSKPQTEVAICKNCKLPFNKLVKRSSKGRTPTGVRGVNCVTCSKKCSKEWHHKNPKTKENE